MFAKYVAKIAAAVMISTLAACSAAAPTATPAVVDDSVSVKALLSITGPTGYRVLTLTAWNKSDINHVKLTLIRVSDSTTIGTKTVANANLATAIAFSNLRASTTYKVLAEAYSDAGATNQIDNGSSADNTTTFTTPSIVSAAAGDNIDDSTSTVSVKVKLKDKTFAGSANSSGGVTVTNGTIVSTSTTESF